MVLTRPITKTVISTTAFGQPVYDWIVANTPTPWTAVQFQNGWINAAGHQACTYRKIGDMVYIRGVMKSGSLGVAAFNLPVGFRPPAAVPITTSSIKASNWEYGYAELGTPGDFIPYYGGTVTFAVNCSYSLTA